MSNKLILTILSIVFIIITTFNISITLTKYNQNDAENIAIKDELNELVSTTTASNKTSTTKKIPATSYWVRGKKYHTLSSDHAKNLTQTGYASWYGPGFHGKKTANGEIYNQNALTAAHKTLPLSTTVKVTNLENNKSITLRVNDRGPYYGNRILDLSKEAAKQLGVLQKGVAKIQLQVLH
jgi:rare lipoprotein A